MPDLLVPAWLGELRPLREDLPVRRQGPWLGATLLLLAVLLGARTRLKPGVTGLPR